MAMSSNQLIFGCLTVRNHDIALALQKDSNTKQGIAREQRANTLSYQKALGKKMYKWSNNGGASYQDLTYSTLMSPNTSNGNKLYLVTDSNNKVVLGTKYEKYAKMISPNGSVGGDYKSHRSEILADLIGSSVEEITSTDTYGSEKEGLEKQLADARNRLAQKQAARENCKIAAQKADDIRMQLSNSDADLMIMSSDQWENIGSEPEKVFEYLSNIFNKIGKNMADLGIMPPEQNSKFQEFCDTFINGRLGFLAYGNEAPLKNEEFQKVLEAAGFQKKDGHFEVNFQKMFNTLINDFNKLSGIHDYGTNPDDQALYTYDPVKVAAIDKEIEAIQAEINSLIAQIDNVQDTSNQTFIKQDEKLIEYYDKLFTAIVDNGWTYDAKIDEKDYLNDSFINNRYYITTITESKDEDGNRVFDYNPSLASNFDKLYPVSDSDAADLAFVEYEYNKSILDDKESRIDIHMKKLQTEFDANKTRMESIKKLITDSVDRTFKIFA